jgi:hypothetical protein
MAQNPAIRAAFVSTNSITQGEQVGILWPDLLSRGVRINFAHRTFQWASEARGKAAVHCVIIGFALEDAPQKWLFDYDTIRSEPHALKVSQINPYLVAAPTVLLPSRTEALPAFRDEEGQPADGRRPSDPRYRRARRASARGAGRRTLHQALHWRRRTPCRHKPLVPVAKGAEPADLRALPKVIERIEAVRRARLQSPTKSVREFAQYPTLFTQDRQPTTAYLAVPEVSSESRRFIPISFLSPSIIASNKLQIIVGGTLYHFGILTSTMHMAWMRTVAGRLKSDYSYAPSVYNTFPWPAPSDSQRAAIEQAAQAVLDARAQFLPAHSRSLRSPHHASGTHEGPPDA